MTVWAAPDSELNYTAHVPTPSDRIVRSSATLTFIHLEVSRWVKRDLSLMQWMVAPESTMERDRRLDDLERGRFTLLSTFILVIRSLSESCVGARGIMHGMSVENIHAASKQER